MPAPGPHAVRDDGERIAVWHVTAISDPAATVGPHERFHVEATLDIGADLQTVLESADTEAVRAALRVWLSHLGRGDPPGPPGPPGACDPPGAAGPS